jgi:hypothetical protein
MPVFHFMAFEMMPYSGVSLWGRFSDPRNAWKDEIGLDEDHPLIAYGRLYNVSSMSDMINGRSQSVDTLHFQNETIGLVQSAIDGSWGKISNELIYTILSLGMTSVRYSIMGIY